MSQESLAHHVQNLLTAYFWSDDTIRSRSVSQVVLTSMLDVPVPSAHLIADWEREIVRLDLQPGDVEALPLARKRARWPDYMTCVQTMSDWMAALGVGDVLLKSEVALMACRGATYHHDAEHYGGKAFCNLFLCEDRGLDLHFPNLDLRFPLTRGLAVIFDTAQPHAVIQRGSRCFNEADFAFDQNCNQLFLSWELPIEDVQLSRALGVDFDIDLSTASKSREEQVCLDGKLALVCPDTGLWSQTQG